MSAAPNLNSTAPTILNDRAPELSRPRLHPALELDRSLETTLMQRYTLLFAANLCLTLLACNPGGQSVDPQSPRSASTPHTSQTTHTERTPRIDPGPDIRQRSAPASAAGSFDFYLLNLSWSPEFCATHASKPECAQHLGFVLHGLWPQTVGGGYPEHCSDVPGPAHPADFRDIYPDSGLLLHEWQAHGTCSGLAPDAFFQLARRAVREVAIPSQLTRLDRQVSMPPATILDLFTAVNASIPRASFALTCGNNYLTAIEVCLSRDLHPVACDGVRSCRASTVRIPPPNPAPL